MSVRCIGGVFVCTCLCMLACARTHPEAEVSSAGAGGWLQTNRTLAGQTFDPSLSAFLIHLLLFASWHGALVQLQWRAADQGVL